MKKDRLFLLTGLVASILLVINYGLTALFLMSETVNSTALTITRLTSPVLLIIALFALKHILVGMADLKNFNLVITSLIVVQLFVFISLLQASPDMVPGRFMGVFVIIIGLLYLGLFIWFSVAVLRIKPDTLRGLGSLKGFVLTTLIIMLLSLILALSGVENKAVTGLFTENSSGIQYIFMLAFFWTRLNI